MKKSVSILLTIIIFIIILLPSLTFSASLNVPLDDWKYEAIDRIALAWGIKYPINSRPMSRLEMGRIIKKILEVKNNQEKDGEEYLEKLLQRLKEELGDVIEELESPEKKESKRSFKSITLEASYGDGHIKRENNFGDMMDRGWHGRIIPSLGFEAGFYAFDITPRIWLDSQKESNDEEFDLLRAYLKLEGDKIAIEVGKNSLWWGPGRRGAWVITNNARPVELIKLYNPRPYAVTFLGDFKFTIIYGRTSKQVITYKYEGTDRTKFERPHFGGMRINFAQSRYFEFGGSMTALFTGRDGLKLDDIKEVFFPRHKAVNREDTIGPVTDRIASFDVAINIPSPAKYIEGMRIYMEYGGTDLSFVDRWYPRLTDVGTLYGLYCDTGATDVRLEYAQNLEHDDTLWYTHGQFNEGYTHKGDIMGHYIGGAARDFYVRLTHPVRERWRLSIDYEHLLIKERFGNIPGRKNQITFGVDYLKDNRQLKIECEYENNESQGISTDNHLILMKWKRGF